MQVSTILNEKGAEVVTTSAATPIQDIAVLLTNKRIGAIVVTDENGAVSGIISERDIVLGLCENDGSLVSQTAGDLMTANVITCDLNSKVDDLMREMTDSRIRHLPVVEDGKLVGLVSIGDVVKNRLMELESESSMLREYIEHG